MDIDIDLARENDISNKYQNIVDSCGLIHLIKQYTREEMRGHTGML